MNYNHYKVKFLTVFSIGLLSLNAQAQEAIPAAGGEASGAGGTVSYTIGQVSYQTESGSAGSVSEGVQQPFEVFVTSVDKVPGITLNVKAYPNPTQGELWLNIENLKNQDLTYQIYDFSGKLIESNPVRDNQTHISLQNYASATYFLRVMSQTSEIKTFKIIKN